MLFILCEVISYFYFWYFTSSWKQSMNKSWTLRCCSSFWTLITCVKFSTLSLEIQYTEHKMPKAKHQTCDIITLTSASCFWSVNNMAVKCKQNVEPCSILSKCWLFHKLLKSFYQFLCWWFCCSVICEWFHYWINVEPPLWCSCLYSEKGVNNREWTLLPYMCCPQLCVCCCLALTQLNTAT